MLRFDIVGIVVVDRRKGWNREAESGGSTMVFANDRWGGNGKGVKALPVLFKCLDKP